MTCDDLDAYTSQVEQHHALSADETKLLKKYRRQIRNRACAQTMRARKRQQTEELVVQVGELRDRAEAAEREADQLRARVGYLEGLLRSRGLPFDGAVSSFASVAPPMRAVATAATVSLFVIIFSVGLFIGGPLGSAGPGPLPRVSVAPLAVGGAPGTGRHLLDNDSAPPPPSRVRADAPYAHLVRRDADGRPAATAAPTAAVPAVVARKSMRVVEAAAAPADRSNALMVSNTVRQHAGPSPYDAKFNRPDTEYMCVKRLLRFVCAAADWPQVLPDGASRAVDAQRRRGRRRRVPVARVAHRAQRRV